MRSLLLAQDRGPLFIGVVHLQATPGAPDFGGSLSALFDAAVRDAQAFVEGGADALVVENFGDAPFFADRVPPETLATLTAAIERVSDVARGLPVGVNVLRNDARAGVGICAATSASFLRVNVHAGAMVTDQGVIAGCAAETLRERARLCPDVVIAADIHVKHATPLGRESLEDAADEAYLRGNADVLIVSGTRTGRPTDLADVIRVKEHLPGAPVWIGSGLDSNEAGEELMRHADGAIVGSALKAAPESTAPNAVGASVGSAPVDVERVRRMSAMFARVRR